MSFPLWFYSLFYGTVIQTLILTLTPPLLPFPQVRGTPSVPRYLAGTNQRDIPATLRPTPGPRGEAVKPMPRLDTMPSANTVYPVTVGNSKNNSGVTVAV